MALPMKTVERLADVEESKGTTEVSPITTTIRSGAIPSSSATIWVKTVRAPCPMSEVPERTDALPSWWSLTSANEAEAVEELFRPSEIPRPWLGPSGVSQAMAAAAFSRASRQLPSAPVSLGMNFSSLSGTLRRRISTRSRPRRSAASLSCDSTAQEACGVPKPRNAVLGVVCESRARETTLAFCAR